MKKIFALSLFIVLFSSFLSGDYITNSRLNKLSPYDRVFPLIKDEDEKYIAFYPDSLRPMPGGDAASNKGTFRIWYENGMGNYSTVMNDSERIGNSGTTTKYAPLMMASILYEHPRRPPGTSARTRFDGNSMETNKSDMLAAGRHIKLFSSTPRVVSDDPMTFAISYKLDKMPVADDYRILLKYNHAGSELGNIFIPLEGKDSLDVPVASEDPGSRGQFILNSNNIPLVRNISQEVVEYYTQSNPFPTPELLKASGTGDTEMGPANNGWANIRFKHVMVLSRLSFDTFAHNIFITFKPGTFDPATVANGSPKVYVEAVLQKINFSKGGIEDVETSRVEDKAADAHDPNDVTVSPECIQLPQKDTKLQYKVNFENTGGGDADKIMIAFTPPRQCVVKNITVTKVVCGGKRAAGPGPNLIYKGHTTDAAGRIIFSIEGLLKGAYINTKPEADPETKGSIEFDLGISPNGDVKEAIEMKAWADIFFHSAAGDPSNDIQTGDIGSNNFPASTIGYEKPVVTDPARTFYREKCGKEPRPCLFAWWWWLILLIILIFVLWWLLRRRRRNPNAS